MQSLSHHEPRIGADCATQPQMILLADAFSEFISASTRLEGSYAALQQEVTHLSHELADRNQALKLSLAENRRVHERLQQIVDSMPCGVLVVEHNGIIAMINPEGRALLELGDDAVTHIEAISSLAGVNLSGFMRRCDQADDEQEFCRQSLSGKRWLAVHDRSLSRKSPAGCNTSESDQTILILRDITAHKQAEFEREQARRATSLSEVAMTLAHEIRNPLASLEIFAGLIATGGDGADECISNLRAGIRSLSSTVNNVLSFHGLGFPVLTAVPLSESILSSVNFARPIAEQGEVKLSFFSEMPDLQIRANPSALQQVVLNLICNAVRHSKKDGTITISVRKIDSSGRQLAQIEFSDSGEGIPPEQLGEIFRPGFSGSGNTSGLGLSVCRQIVQQHDGVIRVMSQLGVGTTFHVEIPAL